MKSLITELCLCLILSLASVGRAQLSAACVGLPSPLWTQYASWALDPTSMLDATGAVMQVIPPGAAFPPVPLTLREASANPLTLGATATVSNNLSVVIGGISGTCGSTGPVSASRSISGVYDTLEQTLGRIMADAQVIVLNDGLVMSFQNANGAVQFLNCATTTASGCEALNYSIEQASALGTAQLSWRLAPAGTYQSSPIESQLYTNDPNIIFTTTVEPPNQLRIDTSVVNSMSYLYTFTNTTPTSVRLDGTSSTLIAGNANLQQTETALMEFLQQVNYIEATLSLLTLTSPTNLLRLVPA